MLLQLAGEINNRGGKDDRYIFVVGPGMNNHTTLVILDYKDDDPLSSKFYFIDNHGVKPNANATSSYNAQGLDNMYLDHIENARRTYQIKTRGTDINPSLNAFIYIISPTIVNEGGTTEGTTGGDNTPGGTDDGGSDNDHVSPFYNSGE